MIYIEEKSFEAQIALLKHFLAHGEFDLIVWFLPESKIRNVCDLKLSPKDLIEGEQVTTYSEGFIPKKTRRVKFTSELLNKIKESKAVIQANCDSLVLYPQNEKRWFVGTIAHEGMSLVNDDSQINILNSAGFKASLEKPECW